MASWNDLSLGNKKGYLLAENLVAKQDYVFRAFGKVKGEPINLYLGDTLLGELEDGVLYFSLASDSSDTMIYTERLSSTSYIEKIKLERGTKPTDWTLAEEDYAEAIGQVRIQLKRTVNGLASVVSTHDGRFSKFEQIANGFQSSVINLEDQTNSDITQLSNSFRSRIQNTESGLESQISQMDKAINLRVKKGEMVSQINAEFDNILIDTPKLNINSDTVNISGEAFMSGAVIKDATIDAAKIINIDFDNAVGNNVNLSGRIDAHSGKLGLWNFNDYIYTETPNGFTTLKPGGGVAIGFGSANATYTDGYPEHTMGQLYHNGNIHAQKIRAQALVNDGDSIFRGDIETSYATKVNGHRVKQIDTGTISVPLFGVDGNKSGKKTVVFDNEFRTIPAIVLSVNSSKPSQTSVSYTGVSHNTVMVHVESIYDGPVTVNWIAGT